MCEWLLERVKKDVQVWKREWYGASSTGAGEGTGEQRTGVNGGAGGDEGVGDGVYEGKVDRDTDGEDGPYVAKDGQAGELESEVGAMWKANH